MIKAVILLSLISNVWCARLSGRNFFIEFFSQNDREKSCEWGAALKNGKIFLNCDQGNCKVSSSGISPLDGTTRTTRCDPEYTLIHGNETDVCHNGEWSSSGHQCVLTQSTISSSSGGKWCTTDVHCADNQQCQTCLDLCLNVCAVNSICKVLYNFPTCKCRPGYKGSPYNLCSKEENTSGTNHHPETPVSECRWLTSAPTSTGGNSDTCLVTDDQLPGELTKLKRGEFPYLGIIGDEAFNRSCYGVLISEQWFLSSADCCETCGKRVKLGIFDDHFGQGKRMPEYEVSEKRIHPEYEGGDLDNLGLYKLKSAVRFSRFIRPACLVVEHQPPATKAVFLGNLNGTLMKTTTNIWSEDQCKDSSLRYDDKSMFCVNNLRSTKSLQTYSGLPLVGPMKKPYCMYGLLGLATFGEQTKSKGYMRLSYFLPWIEEIVFP